MEEEKLTTKERKKPERLEAKNGVIVNLSASEDATRTRIVLILVHHLSMWDRVLGKRRGNAKDRQQTSLLPAESFFGGEVRRGTTSPFIVVVEKEKREPNPNPTQSPHPHPYHHRPLAWYCKQSENLHAAAFPQPFPQKWFFSKSPHLRRPRRVRDSTKKESRNRRILLLLHRRPSPAYPSHMHIGGEKEGFGMEKKGEMEVGNHFLLPPILLLGRRVQKCPFGSEGREKLAKKEESSPSRKRRGENGFKLQSG